MLYFSLTAERSMYLFCLPVTERAGYSYSSSQRKNPAGERTRSYVTEKYANICSTYCNLALLWPIHTERESCCFKRNILILIAPLTACRESCCLQMDRIPIIQAATLAASLSLGVDRALMR